MPMTQHKNVTAAIKILQRGRDHANTEAGGIAEVVDYTRYEVAEMITLLLDVDARGQLDESAKKRKRAAKKKSTRKAR
jgi:hypothetical protein